MPVINIVQLVVVILSICGFVTALEAKTKKMQHIGLAAIIIGTIIAIAIAATAVHNSPS